MFRSSITKYRARFCRLAHGNVTCVIKTMADSKYQAQLLLFMFTSILLIAMLVKYMSIVDRETNKSSMAWSNKID